MADGWSVPAPGSPGAPGSDLTAARALRNAVLRNSKKRREFRVGREMKGAAMFVTTLHPGENQLSKLTLERGPRHGSHSRP